MAVLLVMVILGAQVDLAAVVMVLLVIVLKLLLGVLEQQILAVAVADGRLALQHIRVAQALSLLDI